MNDLVVSHIYYPHIPVVKSNKWDWDGGGGGGVKCYTHGVEVREEERGGGEREKSEMLEEKIISLILIIIK